MSISLFNGFVLLLLEITAFRVWHRIMKSPDCSANFGFASNCFSGCSTNDPAISLPILHFV
jgi:hypothetical protein